MKKLLLIGDPNSIYVHNYTHQLRKHFGETLIIDIFATFPPRKRKEAMAYDSLFGYPCDGGSTGNGKPWLRPWKLFRFLKERKGSYDAVHVLYCIQDLMIVGKALRKAAPRLILTVFGSDFFQLANWKRRRIRPVFRSADLITSNNSTALESIHSAFSASAEQMRLCRFGFNTLDKLAEFSQVTREESRISLGIPQEKTVICIGYNYDSIQQHIPILTAITQNGELLWRKENLFFLIPMTYGTEPSYRTELTEALKGFPFSHLTFEKFLSEKENAHLRKAPDIMVQLQKSDSLSASTQEHMYGGNILITGSWLPYTDMVKAGIYFRTIDSVQDIGNEIADTVAHLEQETELCANNPEAIYRMSSWAANLPSWLALYE